MNDKKDSEMTVTDIAKLYVDDKLEDFDPSTAFGFWHFEGIRHCFVGTLDDCTKQKDEYLKAQENIEEVAND